MTKQRIIGIMNDFVRNSNIAQFVSESDGYNKIGTSQFRSLANMCLAAECYDEIELLIEYNSAKNESWGKIKDTLVSAMRTVRNESSDDVLDNLSLFFGYLYWKYRIIASEKAKEGGSR